jgi:hypothetical protein
MASTQLIESKILESVLQRRFSYVYETLVDACLNLPLIDLIQTCVQP